MTRSESDHDNLSLPSSISSVPPPCTLPSAQPSRGGDTNLEDINEDDNEDMISEKRRLASPGAQQSNNDNKSVAKGSGHHKDDSSKSPKNSKSTSHRHHSSSKKHSSSSRSKHSRSSARDKHRSSSSASSINKKQEDEREQARNAKFRQADLGHRRTGPAEYSVPTGASDVPVEATLVQDLPVENTVPSSDQETIKPPPTPTLVANVQPASSEQPDVEAAAKEQERQQQQALEKKKQQAKKQRCLVIVGLVVVALIGAGVGVFFGLQSSAKTADSLLAVPPTAAPTVPVQFNYPPPSKADCEAIANGQRTSGTNNSPEQDDVNFNVELDVSLEFDTSASVIVPVLSNAIQSKILPSLAGCEDLAKQRRLQQAHDPNQYVIGDAQIASTTEVPNASCQPDAATPCQRFQVNLQLLLKGDEPIYKLVGKILEAFSIDGSSGSGGRQDEAQRLKDKLQLTRPFTGISVASVRAATNGDDDDDHDDDHDDDVDDDDDDLDDDLDDDDGDGDGDGDDDGDGDWDDDLDADFYDDADADWDGDFDEDGDEPADTDWDGDLDEDGDEPADTDWDGDEDADDGDEDADWDADADADEDWDADLDEDWDADADADLDGDLDGDLDADADWDGDFDEDSEADADADLDWNGEFDEDWDEDWEMDADGDADDDWDADLDEFI